MTCIVGIAESGHVWIAADSCVSTGDVESETASPKVATRDGWAWGMAGAWRAVVAVRDYLAVPDQGDAGELYARVCALLKGMGAEDDDWEMVAGSEGRLYVLSEACSWHAVPVWQSGRRRKRSPRSWAACGSGGAYATGCLDAIADSDLTPEQRYTEALTVASRRVSGVRPPWRHVET